MIRLIFNLNCLSTFGVLLLTATNSSLVIILLKRKKGIWFLKTIKSLSLFLSNAKAAIKSIAWQTRVKNLKQIFLFIQPIQDYLAFNTLSKETLNNKIWRELCFSRVRSVHLKQLKEMAAIIFPVNVVHTIAPPAWLCFQLQNKSMITFIKNIKAYIDHCKLYVYVYDLLTIVVLSCCFFKIFLIIITKEHISPPTKKQYLDTV